MPIDLEQKLSRHFKLKDLIRTSNRKIDNTPTEEVVAELTTLAKDFLEPIWEKFGQLYVTSGYRCSKLNTSIGGAKNSAHKFGCAADFVAVEKIYKCQQVVTWIVDKSGLEFDQVIDEYSPTSNWVHLGNIRPGYETVARKQALTFKDGKYIAFVK